MASFKFIASIVFFVSLISAPIAQAQQGGLGDLLGGLGGNGSGVGLLGLINIIGNISCSLDGSSSVVNGVATPPFPNALVQLQCGGNVVSSARTNAEGMFSILLDPVLIALSKLLSACNTVMPTPLSTCNPKLPSDGRLVSGNLQLLETTVSGPLSIIKVVPRILKFVHNLN
ncbi:hypothetical protein LIER_06939 [Lithospermum erythrorhizon]|uniref:Phylloplanin n=1 Tax=Lithospermum erythrorhizon TaxID=34254 RepID=A0AAV3P7D7_LITER